MPTQALTFHPPDQPPAKEDVFRVIRPVDLLGMVGRVGLLAQSGMEEVLFLLPDSNHDVVPKVLDFFKMSDGAEFSADSRLLVCNMCPPIHTVVMPSEMAFFRHRAAEHLQVHIDEQGKYFTTDDKRPYRCDKCFR